MFTAQFQISSVGTADGKPYADGRLLRGVLHVNDSFSHCSPYTVRDGVVTANGVHEINVLIVAIIIYNRSVDAIEEGLTARLILSHSVPDAAILTASESR